jgi:hypothetical protein
MIYADAGTKGGLEVKGSLAVGKPHGDTAAAAAAAGGGGPRPPPGISGEGLIKSGVFPQLPK